MPSRRVVVSLWEGSDGDATHRSTNPAYTSADDSLYLEKLGTKWMQARGEALPGITYVLERLPAGYQLYQRTRIKGPQHIDKHLFGHPLHKIFDSPNRFWPHFEFLMNNAGDAMGCPCTVCNAAGAKALPMGSTSSSKKAKKSPGSDKASSISTPTLANVGEAQRRGRPKFKATGLDTSRVDEEGTPDVIRNLIDKTRKDGAVDEEIEEPLSLDWHAERETLPKRLNDLKNEPQWLPREGDIVLFVRKLEKGVEIARKKNGEFKLWHVENKEYLGWPAWEAGLVGQPPAETATIDDLVEEHGKETNVSYSGVRVELLPDPNGVDKALSKQYAYVPIHYTRPFIFWKDFLAGTPEAEWHPTIKNALTVMATVTQWAKYRFRGTWPEAQIYCHGLYIGSEMLGVGDYVRMLPKAESSEVTDILLIKSIRVKITNLDVASENDYDEGRPYNFHLYVYGQGYTLDAGRSSKEWLSLEEDSALPNEFGPLYPLHPWNKEMQVFFTRIVGRVFEAPALSLWFPSKMPKGPDLSQGLAGVLEAREFAQKTDKRITSSFGTSWYWGESRAEALDLHTINGLEVSNFNIERNPKDWRRHFKTVEASERAVSNAPVRSLRDFMAPQELPLRTSAKASRGHAQSGVVERVEEQESSHKTTSISMSSSVSRKRAKVVNLSSDSEDEDEDEICAATKVVEQNGHANPERKKQRVEIRIE
ncbi:hypothetical protein EJ04DRAFT_73481 [Polyplosphaeria fusca]|uniref:Cryptic loci regulator 2 N-terminal domain-containing protein n=1 Tax=Polyplosphaeria fusca TaxID=682080 RepID=A0A9P4QN45_9PLEO|nr:hypothetical protein EJ04DRAFT_73481 [Polyplosphaeria fusca]